MRPCNGSVNQTKLYTITAVVITKILIIVLHLDDSCVFHCKYS